MMSLHETTITDGVSRMRAIERLPLAPGARADCPVTCMGQGRAEGGAGGAATAAAGRRRRSECDAGRTQGCAVAGWSCRPLAGSNAQRPALPTTSRTRTARCGFPARTASRPRRRRWRRGSCSSGRWPARSKGLTTSRTRTARCGFPARTASRSHRPCGTSCTGYAGHGELVAVAGDDHRFGIVRSVWVIGSVGEAQFEGRGISAVSVQCRSLSVRPAYPGSRVRWPHPCRSASSRRDGRARHGNRGP